MMREIEEYDLADLRLMRILSDNRNSYAGSFFSTSLSTMSTTKKFLSEILDSNSKSLFLIFSLENGYDQPILFGHIGYEIVDSETIEVTNVMKIPGMELRMTAPLKAFIEFLIKAHPTKRLFLRVLKDNIRAVSLYTKCGFSKVVGEYGSNRIRMELNL
jgi:RimJ/RimL family protein N-acetyltransferase